MTDEHDFDITLVEERSFDTVISSGSVLSESHSFSSTLNIRNLFNIVIDGMTTPLSWFVRITQGITIVAPLSSIQKLSPTIRLKRIVISALTSITKKFISEIKLKRIVINAPIEQTINNPVTIALKRILITPAIRILRNTIIDISIPKIAIVANATLGNFVRLWSYDATALWTMDGETLSDLDYTES